MIDHFETSRRKLARANEHAAELERKIVAFLPTCHAEPFAEPDPNRPGFTFLKARLTKGLPHGIQEVAGDCVNNFREALDYATMALVRVRIPDPRDVHFPFGRSSDDFERALNGRCKDIPEMWPLFRSFEPYGGGSEALYALNLVCNRNKHGGVLVPMASATFSAGVNAAGTGWISMPYPRPVWDHDKNEIELATLGPGATLQGHFDFAIHVALGEVEFIKGQDAIEVVHTFADMVETIINEIEAEARRLKLIL